MDELTTRLLMQGQLADPNDLLLADGVDPMAFSEDVELGPEPGRPVYHQPSISTTPLSTRDRIGMALADTPGFNPMAGESAFSSAIRGMASGAAQGFSAAQLGDLKQRQEQTAQKNARAKTEADRNYELLEATYKEKLRYWLKQRADEKGIITLSRRMADRMGRPEYAGRRMALTFVESAIARENTRRSREPWNLSSGEQKRILGWKGKEYAATHAGEDVGETATKAGLKWTAVGKPSIDSAREALIKAKAEKMDEDLAWRDYYNEMKKDIARQLRSAKTPADANRIVDAALASYPELMGGGWMRTVLEETENRLGMRNVPMFKRLRGATAR